MCLVCDRIKMIKDNIILGLSRNWKQDMLSLATISISRVTHYFSAKNTYTQEIFTPAHTNKFNNTRYFIPHKKRFRDLLSEPSCFY